MFSKSNFSADVMAKEEEYSTDDHKRNSVDNISK